MLDSKDFAGTEVSKVHKQKRAVDTKAELIRAARVIFARDGFEHARIEDIAIQAGKTRGAFYANFEDKEDVFCAIFEENLSASMKQLSPLLHELPSQEERIRALSDFLVSLSSDHERTLLSLEFKLYAIRHPHRRKRLADLYTSMCMCNCVPELTALVPQMGRHGLHAQATDLLSISGILDGFAVNHLFDPDRLCTAELGRYMRLFLHEMLFGEVAPAT